MNVNNAAIDTYSPKNMFSFNCPIFNATVEIRQCLVLRDLVWKGKGPVVRKGCQVCMSASKCPIVPMVRKMTEETDIYYSAEPKTGRLSTDLLKDIAPILVPEHLLRSEQFSDISPAQLIAIRSANETAQPLKTGASAPKRAPAPIKLESVEADKPTITATPAGMDYAALVNVTMKEEK